MGAVRRGIKNAFRNNVRTLSVVIILAISLGMSLVMLISMQTVQQKIDNVKSSIGNYITVSPAGIRGFEGGGTLLTDANVSDITKIANVTKTVKVTEDRLTNGTNTSLTSAINPGSFGNRQRNIDFGGDPGSGTSAATPPVNFTLPVTVTGVNDLSVTAALGVSSFDVTSGEKFDANTSDNVAMVGKDLATKNNLSVGSTFQAYGKDVKVVGIFDGGNTFSNSGLVMPIAALQNLSGQSGQISQVIVEASSIDQVSSVETNIKTKLGSAVDVVSQQDSSSNAVTPLQNIKTISLYSLIGSLAAGAVIIFLTMVMIVRERRREIGVLKAIGASNAIIVTQFVSESLILTLISGAVGVVLGLLLSNPVLNVLVNNSSSSTSTSGGPGGFGGGAGRVFARIGSETGDALRNLNANVGYDILLYGFLAAILIAIIGSAIPAYLISKVRPAEVLRSE
ncbi:MAG: FtsX-like permease family protein [Patescibacteria group bacterium]|jgi:putative ABC transport system permease protein